VRFRVEGAGRRAHKAGVREVRGYPANALFRRLAFTGCGFGFGVDGQRFRVSGLGSGVWGLGFQVSGFGFRVTLWGFRFRVSGRFWIRVSGLRVGVTQPSYARSVVRMSECARPNAFLA
jgi:hypothetical protein